MKSNIMFETERFVVSLPSPNDLEKLVKLCTNESVMLYFGGIRTREFIEKRMYEFLDYYAQDGFGYGLVHLKSSGEFIGRTGLNRLEFKRDEDRIETGMLLLPEYWNAGYATEIGIGRAKYAFEGLKLPRIYSTIDEKNIWSIKLAHKLGCTFVEKITYFGEPKNLYVKYNPDHM